MSGILKKLILCGFVLFEKRGKASKAVNDYFQEVLRFVKKHILTRNIHEYDFFALIT